MKSSDLFYQITKKYQRPDDRTEQTDASSFWNRKTGKENPCELEFIRYGGQNTKSPQHS